MDDDDFRTAHSLLDEALAKGRVQQQQVRRLHEAALKAKSDPEGFAPLRQIEVDQLAASTFDAFVAAHDASIKAVLHASSCTDLAASTAAAVRDLRTSTEASLTMLRNWDRVPKDLLRKDLK